MDNNRKFGNIIVDIAKKAHKSIDMNKFRGLQSNMLAVGGTIGAVGLFILIIGVVLMVLLPKVNTGSPSFISIIFMAIGVLVLCVGLSLYKVAREMYFGGSILDNIDKEKICPNCGEANGNKDIFCGKCGKKILKEKVCRKCKLQNEEDAKYCVKCGKKLDSE